MQILHLYQAYWHLPHNYKRIIVQYNWNCHFMHRNKINQCILACHYNSSVSFLRGDWQPWGNCCNRPLSKTILGITLLHCLTMVMVTHALVIYQVNFCNELYMGLPLKSIQKFHLGAKCSDMSSYVHPLNGRCCNSALQAALVIVCFWFQLKVLVMSFKALHDTGAGYLRGGLSPVIFACLRKGILWAPSVKELPLAGSKT